MQLREKRRERAMAQDHRRKCGQEGKWRRARVFSRALSAAEEASAVFSHSVAQLCESDAETCFEWFRVISS